MLRLIDANLLKRHAFPDEMTGEGIVYVEDIDEAPTVDAVEVVHGRWKHQYEKGMSYNVCSICGCRNGLDLKFNYCPNCGAKMDGDGNA